MKRHMIALIALTFIGMAQVAKAEESIKSVSYFEPTQEDWNCCSKEIVAQQGRYEAAKESGKYAEAVNESLFYWTRAWLHFNKAVKTAYKKKNWKNIGKLNEALKLLDLAEADAMKAPDGNGHASALDCIKKCHRNRKTIEDQLTKLGKVEE